MKLSAVRSSFQELLKLADYPTLETIKPIVKDTIDDLIDDYEEAMSGSLYASNVDVSQKDDTVFVYFILNYDREKEDKYNYYKVQRDPLVIDTITNKLQSQYRNFTFKVKYGDAPTSTGWFQKKYD